MKLQIVWGYLYNINIILNRLSYFIKFFSGKQYESTKM